GQWTPIPHRIFHFVQSCTSWKTGAGFHHWCPSSRRGAVLPRITGWRVRSLRAVVAGTRAARAHAAAGKRVLRQRAGGLGEVLPAHQALAGHGLAPAQREYFANGAPWQGTACDPHHNLLPPTNRPS